MSNWPKPIRLNSDTREAIEIMIYELRKGAAGPCDYWFKQLANRLSERLDPPPSNSRIGHLPPDDKTGDPEPLA